MHALSTYDFNAHTVRVMDRGGEPWFLGMDLCAVLGFVSPSYAYGRLDESEKSYVGRTHLGMAPGKPAILISESGLYKLILRSDKPEARPFQDWVTKVVLPAIRKDGGYIRGEETLGQPGGMDEDEFLARALMVAQRKIERVTQERDTALADKAVLQAENEAWEEEWSHCTVEAFRVSHGLYWRHGTKTWFGKRASKLCVKRGIEVVREDRKLPDGRDAHVNKYPREVLDEVLSMLQANPR